MNGEVRVVDDVPAAFAALAAQEFASSERADRWTIALSGGSTARPCYELLAKQDIDWSLVTAVWGDERCVPLDHEDSNFRLAKESMFDNCESLGAIHPMRCDQGAHAYDDIVRALLPLDFVHLGMGDDGHTASLFPGSPALESPPEALVVETGDEFHEHPRMTLTFAALAQSKLAVFTVMGASKREMFTRIRAGEHFPAGRVTAERIIWLVDEAASPSSSF